MTTSATRTRRIRRTAIIIGGIAAAGIVALPGVANADTYVAQRLSPGGSQCASQYAGYQARTEGTASNAGAKFRVYKDGAQIAASANPTTSGFTAEFRTSWGNFPGPGYYTICADNKQATNTFVTLRVRTDAEI
ncbi:MAG: hypothetical protein AUI14_10510 [Actinobacteria bacterium 13_2_20CM_2_71_6]|nr:MAG: hypothetical protein AUI14_10510 [Actinobacteria bacterium 13_2_20CM_2_71_6]